MLCQRETLTDARQKGWSGPLCTAWVSDKTSLACCPVTSLLCPPVSALVQSACLTTVFIQFTSKRLFIFALAKELGTSISGKPAQRSLQKHLRLSSVACWPQMVAAGPEGPAAGKPGQLQYLAGFGERLCFKLLSAFKLSQLACRQRARF